MNGNSILLDTNTVLYLLGGKISTDFLPEGVYYISFITELELLSYPNISETESNTIQQFINGIDIIDINKTIKTKTIELRKKYKLKLPDAIICATAVYLEATLITSDKKLKKVSELKVTIPSIS